MMTILLVRNIDEERPRRLKDECSGQWRVGQRRPRARAIAEYVKLDKLPKLMGEGRRASQDDTARSAKMSTKDRSREWRDNRKNATGDARGRCKRRGPMGSARGSFRLCQGPAAGRRIDHRGGSGVCRNWQRNLVQGELSPAIAADLAIGDRSVHCAGADGRTRRTRHQHRHQAEAPDLRLFFYRAGRARRRRASLPSTNDCSGSASR